MKKIKLENVDNILKITISVITIISSLFVGIYKLIDYFYGLTMFKYYGLDFALYTSDDSLIFYISRILIVEFLLCLAIWAIHDKKGICKKKWLNNIFEKILIPSFLNFISICILASSINWVILIIFLIIYWIFEAKAIKPIRNDEENINNVNWLQMVLTLLLGIIIIVASVYFSWYSNYRSKTEYRIINNDKVVVFANEDYYLTLDAKIKDSNVVIYKGTQRKIFNNNIDTRTIKFENVKLRSK